MYVVLKKVDPRGRPKAAKSSSFEKAQEHSKKHFPRVHRYHCLGSLSLALPVKNGLAGPELGWRGCGAILMQMQGMLRAPLNGIGASYSVVNAVSRLAVVCLAQSYLVEPPKTTTPLEPCRKFPVDFL